MKKMIIIVMTALLLSSCTYWQGKENLPELQTSSPSSSGVQPVSEDITEPVNRLNVLNTLDATDVWTLKALDSSVIYIAAIKRIDSATGRQEFVLARCNLQDKSVKVLFRDEEESTMSIENMRVAKLKDGLEAVYTGESMFIFKEGKVTQKPIPSAALYVSSYNIGSGRLVYVDSDTLELCLEDGSSKQPKTLFKSIKTKENTEDNMNTIYPYDPLISEDGGRVLFELVQYEAQRYQKVISCDTEGNELGETAQLEIRADSLQTFWMGQKFFTAEVTDSSEDTPSKLATYITVFNLDGTVDKTYNYECDMSTIQNETYEEHSLLAFSHSENLPGDQGFKESIGIIDINTGKADIVYETNKVITSPSVSPDGTHLIWEENGDICTARIDTLKHTPIKTFIPSKAG